MVAIRADNGRLLWEATVATPKGVNEIERIADITSLPVVEGPIVFAVAYQGRIAAVDRVNGKVYWNRQISSYNGIDYENEKIYVSHTLGSLYSLNYETGRTFWRQGDLLNRRLTTPLAMNDVIVVGDLEGYLHFINTEDGKFAARIKVDDEPVMSLAAGQTSSQVIAATRGGGIYVVNVDGQSLPTLAPSETETSTTETESTIDNEATSNREDGEEETRSILFQKDSPLQLEIEDDSGPGITLPKAE
jgi:outer membrane protein assembly factor BamB